MEKRIHNIALSILFSALVWTIVDTFLIAIAFWQFVIIEIIIGIGEVFSNFVRKKFGLLNPEDIAYLDKNKDESQNGLQ
jgi:hypothetical protein